MEGLGIRPVVGVGKGTAHRELFTEEFWERGFEARLDAVVLALLVCGAGLVHVDDKFVAGARGRAIDDLACELWVILITVYSHVGS